MQTEFRAIVHGEYGAAEDVLRLAECQFKSEELGPDDVLVQVTARPVQAVRAYTFGSAFAEFAENEKGTITKGKLADLVVLSQDIFVARAPELSKTNSALTIVGGKIVYDANVLK